MSKSSTKRGGADKKSGRGRAIKRATKKSPTIKQAQPIQADWQRIEGWAKEICAHGDDGDRKTTAFLLLMDEISRASRDAIRVDLVTCTAMQAGFANSEFAWKARDKAVERLRLDAGLSL